MKYQLARFWGDPDQWTITNQTNSSNIKPLRLACAVPLFPELEPEVKEAELTIAPYVAPWPIPDQSVLIKRMGTTSDNWFSFRRKSPAVRGSVTLEPTKGKLFQGDGPWIVTISNLTT